MSSVRADTRRASRRRLRRREIAAIAAVALGAGAVAATAAESQPEAYGQPTNVAMASANEIAPAPPPAQYSEQEEQAIREYLKAGRLGPAPITDPFGDDILAAVARSVATADAEQQATTARDAMWERLAECESGNWDRHGTPIRGSARWDYGLTFSHGDIFEGGVNFHPATWEAYRDPGMPGHAGQATRAQQIRVAERVLADQGWRAWPVCSRKLGYR